MSPTVTCTRNPRTSIIGSKLDTGFLGIGDYRSYYYVSANISDFVVLGVTEIYKFTVIGDCKYKFEFVNKEQS